ncbi:MAG: LysR family transcriptional regulator [Clostridia bacterium]|nr:LysR family transcriptional regulator [Clostridia bacterium]
MNTSQLECFVRVAETFSFQQAADDLHISQPAVSKQIIALETEIGAPLFIRTTRTVALTTVGEKFLADAKRMLQMTYHARQLSAGAQRKEGQMLRIGYTDSGELYFMTRAFQKLKEKYPDFLPLLVYNKWDINTLEVEHGRLDVCFSFKRNGHNSHLVFQQISDNKMVCLMPLSHPLAGSDFIRFEQIKDEQQVCVVPLPHRTTAFITRTETKPSPTVPETKRSSSAIPSRRGTRWCCQGSGGACCRAIWRTRIPACASFPAITASIKRTAFITTRTTIPPCSKPSCKRSMTLSRPVDFFGSQKPPTRDRWFLYIQNQTVYSASSAPTSTNPRMIWLSAITST